MFSNNVLDVENIQGKSTSTTLVCQNPHKWIPTKSTFGEFSVFSSSYGGGLVQGDHINIDINVKENARLCIRSQGNQHVYKNNQSSLNVVQNTTIELSKSSRLAILTDPVVLHQDANFSQSYSVKLDQTSEFLIIDSFTSGRNECGESFLFNDYRSCFSFEIDQQLSMLDSFGLQPKTDPFNASSSCGRYQYFISIYCFGAHAEQWLNSCWKFNTINEMRRVNELKSSHDHDHPQFCFALSRDQESGITQARCYAEKRCYLDDFIHQLSSNSFFLFN